MQGARISQSCSNVGAVYIYTSQLVSKRYSDKIRKNHKNNAKIDPKLIEIIFFLKAIGKMMRTKNKQNILPQVSQQIKFDLPFCHHLLGPFPLWRIFFGTSFRNLWGGALLDRFWPPLGHPCSDFVNLLEDFSSNLIHISKILGQWHQPHL